MSPCNSCHSGCCRSFAVPVSGADIIRIEDKVDLTFWDFVCRWEDPDNQIAGKCAPQFFFSDEPATPFTICLSYQDSRFFAGTTKCRFLVEEGPDAQHPCGTARCDIYSHRPGICRAFPAKLNATDDLAVICDVPRRGRKLDDGDNALYQLCSRQWEPSDFDPIDTVQDLVLAKYEMAFFHQLADIWNRKPREWSCFPDFLRLVYSRRVVRESAAEEEAAEAPMIHSLPFVNNQRSLRAA